MSDKPKNICILYAPTKNKCYSSLCCIITDFYLILYLLASQRNSVNVILLVIPSNVIHSELLYNKLYNNLLK